MKIEINIDDVMVQGFALWIITSYAYAKQRLNDDPESGFWNGQKEYFKLLFDWAVKHIE